MNTQRSSATNPGDALVTALAQRDFARLADTLTADLRIRAPIPPGPPARRNRPASHGSRPPRLPPTRPPRSFRSDPERRTPRARGADDRSSDRADEARPRNYVPAPSPPNLGDTPPTPAAKRASR